MRGRAIEDRRGFALAGILVIVALMLLAVALAASSSVAVRADHQRIDLAGEVLAQLTDSSLVGVTRFHADVGLNPGRIQQLIAQITSDDNHVCGKAYTKKQADEWGGPYVFRAPSPEGLWVGVGRARDQLDKDPPDGTPTEKAPQALVVTVDDVDERDAWLLNVRFDPEGETSPASEGRVRWTAPNAEGRVTLFWRRTITSC